MLEKKKPFWQSPESLVLGRQPKWGFFFRARNKKKIKKYKTNEQKSGFLKSRKSILLVGNSHWNVLSEIAGVDLSWEKQKFIFSGY